MADVDKPLTRDLKYLFCGGVAGCISRTSVAPLERLKIMFQVQDILKEKNPSKYSGVRNSIMRILREEGWRGLYKGNGTNCVRVFPYTATQFLVFEKLKPLLLGRDEEKLNTWSNLLGGAVAGIVSVSFTYPLDFVRARLTCQGSVLTGHHYSGIWDALHKTASKEGVSALYRGISPTLMGIAPYVGLNFMVFESLKVGAPKDEDGRPDIYYLLGCGALAGACGQTAAYPFDLLRRRYQVSSLGASSEYNGGILNAFKQIIRQDGPIGLYKGLWPNFLKVVPSVAVMFVANDLLKHLVL